MKYLRDLNNLPPCGVATAFKWELLQPGVEVDMTPGDWGVQIGMAKPLLARLIPLMRKAES